MLMRKTVTASLEGMRIVVESERCRLEEYDFSENQFQLVEVAAWPLSVTDACRWLAGWNRIDRMMAADALTSPDNPDRMTAVA
jgi:hypothetical protein